MDKYNKARAMVCPHCEGNGTGKVKLLEEDDFGRMDHTGWETVDCELCGGDRVVDEVTTYRRKL